MTDEPIDWSQPIVARKMAWGAPPSATRVVTIPGPPARYHLAAVRAEQIRRAAILIEAAGGKPLTPRTTAPRIARLAAAVPGLRYVVGVFVVSKLAPTVPVLLADPHDHSHPGGRPVEWPPERLRKLLADVERVKAASVANLSDKAALKPVRKAWTAEQEAYDEAERAAGREPTTRPIPEIDRLATLLGDARNLSD